MSTQVDLFTTVEPTSVRPTIGNPTVGSSTVYLMDCVEGMKEYPDKWFDLAVVDPPYGIGVNMNMGVRKGERRKHHSKDWDKEPPNEEYFYELKRVSKNQIIWGANNFIGHLDNSQGWIFWDKMITGEVDFSHGELAWTSFNKSLKKYPLPIQQVYLTEPRIHPTQKPTALYDFCFKYAKCEQGMKVLDTHLGSQSSRIAADKAGLDFTGFEIDIDYFNAGEKRFKDYKSQLRIKGW